MHIQRPEVRIVEPQQEEVKSNEVSGYEANQLLAKYGYSDPLVNNHPPVYNPDNNLTAEQLFQKQLKEEQEKKQRESIRRSNPISYGFDNVNYSENKYASLEGEDFGIQVQIVSDMPIYGTREDLIYKIKKI